MKNRDFIDTRFRRDRDGEGGRERGAPDREEGGHNPWRTDRTPSIFANWDDGRIEFGETSRETPSPESRALPPQRNAVSRIEGRPRGTGGNDYDPLRDPGSPLHDFGGHRGYDRSNHHLERGGSLFFHDRPDAPSIDEPHHEPRNFIERAEQWLSDRFGSHAGKGPKNYRRSDSRIHEEVCECLASHPEIDASDVEVEVVDGEVYLSGTIEDRATKRLTEDLIEHLPGVREVTNRLRLRR